MKKLFVSSFIRPLKNRMADGRRRSTLPALVVSDLWRKRLVAGFAMLAIAIGALLPSFTPLGAAHAGGTIDVWWPSNGSSVSGTQPFKAMLEGWSISSYKMFWSVDGGQLNLMNDNQTDYPHKEAEVDLAGWTWRGTGPYAVAFIAQDFSGNEIGRQTVSITVTGNSGTSQTTFAPTAQTSTSTSNQTQTPTSAQTQAAQTQTQTASSNKNSNNSISFTISTAANQASYAPGAPASVAVHVQASQNVSNALLDLELYDANNSRVNQYFAPTNLAANQDVVTAWNLTAPLISGSYSIRIGIFAGDWSTLYDWDNVAGVLVVADSGTSGSTSGTLTGSSGNPLADANFYVNPNSDAKIQENAWAANYPYGAALMNKIAIEPTAAWFGGWNANVYNDANTLAIAAGGATPVYVAYNIPNRDCGGYSSGGASTPDAYKTWIRNLASGIGNRNAVVILEPDALAEMDCLSGSDQAVRLSLIADAVRTLKSMGNIRIYIDAGHPNWISASQMAARLQNADIADADGFALNVSNFDTVSDNETYGNAISQLTGGKHYVIDTSRNGLGSDGEWCNPSGRALGPKPSANTGSSLADAFLWIKYPGESDGNCNGGPSAGTWWSDYAVGLAQRAAY